MLLSSDRERIAALEARLEELKERVAADAKRVPAGAADPKDHDAILTLTGQVKSLEKSIKWVWGLLGSAIAFVFAVCGFFWHLENKSLNVIVRDALATNTIVQETIVASNHMILASNAANAALVAKTNALSDAEKVKGILSEMASHKLAQGKEVFESDGKGGYKNCKSKSDGSTFFTELKVTNSTPFLSEPRLILSVVDSEPSPPKPLPVIGPQLLSRLQFPLVRWKIEPVNVSTNGFTIRLTQWGPDRLITLGVQWTAVEWPK
jgi:hypothetical protein